MLATMSRRPGIAAAVSVAGCLGYDVLADAGAWTREAVVFQLLVV